MPQQRKRRCVYGWSDDAKRKRRMRQEEAEMERHVRLNADGETARAQESDTATTARNTGTYKARRSTLPWSTSTVCGRAKTRQPTFVRSKTGPLP